VTANASTSVNETVNYCGVFAGSVGGMIVSAFNGLQAFGTYVSGGNTFISVINYWPHNNTIFINAGACYWVLTSSTTNMTVQNTTFNIGNGSNATMWG